VADEGLDEPGLRLHGRHRHLERVRRARQGRRHGAEGVGLDVRLERRLDAQAAAVDLRGGEVLQEPRRHVADEGRIGARRHRDGVDDRGTATDPAGAGEGQTGPQGAGVGPVGEVALLAHLGQDQLPELLGRDEVLARRPVRRRRDEAGEGRRLRRIELRRADVEVVLGGGPDAVVAVTEVDRRQVAVEDLTLAGLAVELTGEDGLPDLVEEGAPATRVGQLDVLLGDGAAALHDALVAHVGDEGPDDAAEIDTTFVVVADVLVGDDGLVEDGRDLRGRDGHAGGVAPERRDPLARRVVDDGRLDDRVAPGHRNRRRQRDVDERGQDGHRGGDGDADDNHHGEEHRARETADEPHEQTHCASA
jgi:hypothetical protein